MSRWPCTCQKSPVVLENQQYAFSLTPAFLHGVQVRRTLGEIHDSDVFVCTKKFPHHLRAMLRCPVTYQHRFSKVPLQLLEVGDECDGVEPFIRPEELLPSKASDPYMVTFLWLPVYGTFIRLPLGDQYFLPDTVSCTKNASSCMITANPSFSRHEIRRLR